MQRSDEEIIKDIKEILTTYIEPSVQEHGGTIGFISYADGVLNLMLGGACSGCAGSTMTLKMGVENMIKYNVPEVEHIEAEDDPNSIVNAYYTHDDFMQQNYFIDDNE